MDLLSLQYFKAVAETENISAVAKERMVAQPAVSKTIRRLEEELGYTVFDRVGRRVVLNENGRILLKYTNKVFQALQNARDEIADFNHVGNKVVHIKLLSASKVFIDILRQFNRRYPKCQIHVDQSPDLGDGYDLSIYSTAQPPVEGENHQTILRERILLVVPRGHPLGRQETVSLADLKEERFLVLTKDKALRRIVDDFCESRGLHLNIYLEADNPSFLREALSLGQGITFMPELTWGELDTETSQSVQIMEKGLVRFINLSANPYKYLHSTAHIFYVFILDYFKALQEKGKALEPGN